MISILGKYRFENNVQDSSGNLNHGAIVNIGIISGGSIVGKGYTFVNNGTTVSYINTNISELSRPFFISVWAQPSSIPASSGVRERVFSCNNVANDVALAGGFQNNTFIITDEASGDYIQFLGATAGTKYHIVVYYGIESGQNILKLYVNGKLIGSKLSTSQGLLTGSITIGGSSLSSRIFNGVIDEVIVGTGEPTLSDVKRMMLGLSPIHQTRHLSNYEKFRDNVLRDGGTFDDNLYKEEFAKLHPILRKESTTLIVPGAYKTGIIYGMNTLNGNLVPLTFSRGTSGSYFDKNRQMQIAGVNVPRINYNPYTGELRGYLFEAATTNLIYNSLFVQANGGWSFSMLQPTYNTGFTEQGRPFVTLTKLDANSNRAMGSSTVSSIANQTYTYRITVRADTSNKLSFGIGANADGAGNPLWGTEADTGFRIIKGPGTITRATGALINVRNLSTTEDTIIEVYRKYTNAGISIIAYVYPDESSSMIQGASVKVSTPQLEISPIGQCTSQIDTSAGALSRQYDYAASSIDLFNDTNTTLYFHGQKKSKGSTNITFARYNLVNNGIFAYNNTNLDQLLSYDGVNVNTVLIAGSNETVNKITGSVGPTGMRLLVNNNGSGDLDPYKGTFSNGTNTLPNVFFGSYGSQLGTHQNHVRCFSIIQRELTLSEQQILTTL